MVFVWLLMKNYMFSFVRVSNSLQGINEALECSSSKNRGEYAYKYASLHLNCCGIFASFRSIRHVAVPCVVSNFGRHELQYRSGGAR